VLLVGPGPVLTNAWAGREEKGSTKAAVRHDRRAAHGQGRLDPHPAGIARIMSTSSASPGPLKRLGLRLKKAATVVYGPSELPDDVDPVKNIDRGLGQTPSSDEPLEPPKRSERQRSYDELPKGKAE
jgi:hypothetical protein